MNGVIVRFNTRPLNPSAGRTLLAIPRANVKAVIRRTALSELINKGFELDTLPPKVRDVLILRAPGEGENDVPLTEADASVSTAELEDGESGPTEVCYWVGTKLVCWGPEEEER